MMKFNLISAHNDETLTPNAYSCEGSMPTEVCQLRAAALTELTTDCGPESLMEGSPPYVDCPINVCCTQCFQKALVEDAFYDLLHADKRTRVRDHIDQRS